MFVLAPVPNMPFHTELTVLLDVLTTLLLGRLLVSEVMRVGVEVSRPDRSAGRR